MAVWLHEAGIGEARAALIEDGRIVEARIEPDDEPRRVGAVLDARLVRGADATGRGRLRLDDGSEADLESPPKSVAEGALLRVEITRLALPERGRLKPPRARPAVAGAALSPGPSLRERIAAGGIAVRDLGPGDDALAAHGWFERIEEAASGIVAGPHALLRIVLTPAMTLIDVDGAGPAATLAIAGARAAGEAIRRFDLAGSIGIDLPTLSAKAERQAAALALDAALPPPFERTAVNGFGFLQIVRRRERPSLPERLAADPAGGAARALLARAGRTPGHGAVTLAAAPAVIARIATRDDWREALARRIGAAVRLQSIADRPIWAGHAQRDHN